MLCWQASDHRHYQKPTDRMLRKQHDKSSPLSSTHYATLYPQNGVRIVAIDTVTSLHPTYNEAASETWLAVFVWHRQGSYELQTSPVTAEYRVVRRYEYRKALAICQTTRIAAVVSALHVLQILACITPYTQAIRNESAPIQLAQCRFPGPFPMLAY